MIGGACRSTCEAPQTRYVLQPSPKSTEGFPGSSHIVSYFDGVFAPPTIPIPEKRLSAKFEVHDCELTQRLLSTPVPLFSTELEDSPPRNPFDSLLMIGRQNQH